MKKPTNCLVYSQLTTNYNLLKKISLSRLNITNPLAIRLLALSIYLLFVFDVGSVWGQTTTITITNATIGGSSVLATSNYNSGAERTWTQSSINFGGKAITCNPSNTPTGALACQYIQAQASNGVIYNTSALPGRIVSIKFTGTANVASSCFGGTSRLVNTTSADYTVGGTQIGTAQTNTTYTWNTDAATNYTFFCIKRGTSTQYFSSIEVTYESATSPTLTLPTVSSITTTTATLGATVTSNGGAALISRGTVWGTTVSPTGNSLVEGGTSISSYSHSRTGLTANTAYIFRGYATNTAGTGYSADGTFTTLPLAPTVGIGNSITSSSFTANWSHPTMGSETYTYSVEVDDDINFGSINSSFSSILSSNTSQTITGLSASTTYYFRVKAVNSQGSSDWSTTSEGVTTSSTASPTLNAVTLSSALSSTYGTASTGISFTANGSNLTAENITANAQQGYEVSTTLSSGYVAAVSVAAGTILYVRFASSIPTGNKDNAIAVVLSGGGATSSVNVTTSSSGNSVAKATPNIISAPTASDITYGQTLASSTLSGGLVSVAGSFVFTSPSTSPNGGTANHSITFTPTDNTNYNITTTDVSVTVNKANQTITFGTLANKTTSDSPFALTGTTSSGLTVSYSSSNTAVATITGSTVTIVGAGQTTITASQAGNGNYNAATSVDQTLTVTSAPVTIFTENIGSPSGTTSISLHTFQNSPLFTFTNGGSTNSADVRNTNASSVYTGASGNGNVFFSSTVGSYGFAIEGIDVSTYTNLEVRFAYRKESSTVLPNLTLEYWNGSSYVNVPFTFNEATNATAGWYMVNWISLPASAQLSSLRLRWVKSGGNSVRLDDISLRGLINNSPLILVSQNSLNGFSQNSSSPSTELSYTISGDNLTNNVTITPPSGFEISTSTGGSFSATNPITLTTSDGNIVGEPVTIYVRQSTSTLGVVSGNITHTSTGSNDPSLALSGVRTGSFYSKSTGNLDDLSTWGMNTDGSGISPSNFNTDGIVYEIRNRANATIGANWSVSGTASKVLVGDGVNPTDFTIPSTFTLTGTIDLNNASELTIENTTAPTFGTIADQGTIEYKDVAITLSTTTTYKNLKLSGSGTKTFPGNTTTIKGNLIFENTTLSAPSSAPFSSILLGGNLTYVGTVTPPNDASSITLSTNGTAGGTQTITGAGNTLRWFRITTTTANTIFLSTTEGSSDIVLGNLSGGGITLTDGSVFNLNGNNLTLVNSNSTSPAFLFNNSATISTNASSDFTIERTGNGNLGTIRFTTGASTIGSLTLNHTGSINKSLLIANQLTIANSLSLTSGILDVGISTLIINGSISQASGNIDASNSSATVVFGGSTTQTIPASTFSGNINNLTLNNGAGLNINQDISVIGVLTLSSGLLTLGSNHLTLGLNTTIVGTPSASNMIIANGNGELRKRFTQGSGDVPSFTFPVGTIGDVAEFTPIVLDFESGNYGANAYVGVRVQDNKQAMLNSSVTNYLNRNWIVEPNDITGYLYKIQLHYVDADFITDGSLAEGDLLPIKISSGQWYQPIDGTFTNAEQQGFAGVFANNNYLEWNGLETFSEFGGAGGTNQPLPVELISFNASCLEEQIIVTWQTASENNSSHFDIEKSRDGQTWNVIGQQLAAGNSTELMTYQFLDTEKNNSGTYYRLNQVDLDGKSELFGPVTTDCDAINYEVSTLPNPSNGNFWIKIQSNESSSAELKLVDVKGNILFKNEINIQNGINVYPITHVLQSGLYFIHIQNSKDQKTTVLKHFQN